MSALQQLEELLERFDADLKFDRGCRSAWSGQLRLTLTNPAKAPSRSITFFSAGGFDPEDVAAVLLADVEKWLKETDTAPMPVPEWME